MVLILNTVLRYNVYFLHYITNLYNISYMCFEWSRLLIGIFFCVGSGM
jgi:hypothetical protein